MAWYYGTYRCGHEGRINVIGPGKDRQWRIDREFSRLCYECYKKEQEEKRAAENKAAAEKSVEMELPELSGTEKQIAWANTLRIQAIEECEKNLDFYREKKKKRPKLELSFNDSGDQIIVSEEELLDALDYGLRSETDAKFWIENRELKKLFIYFLKKYKEHKLKNSIPDDVKEELLKEQEAVLKEKQALTVSPDVENKKGGIVFLSYNESNSMLSASYPKNTKFREIVKELGFSWNGYIWRKEISEYTGTATERAAELGNKLLLNGFTVQFIDRESKEGAIAGNFSPECKRWIKYIEGKLSVIWEERNNRIYDASIKISGAKWRNGAVRIPIDFYREVQEFAKALGFRFSRLAQEEIDKYKRKEAGFEVASAVPPSPVVLTDMEDIRDSLLLKGAIIEDLLDEA